MKKISKIKKLKIPPPIVTIVFATFMLLLNLGSNFHIDILGNDLLVVMCAIIASLLLFPAVVQFYRSKTTVNPLKPETAKVLVVKGVYRFSRNPMYLGMALALLAWGIYLSNPLNIFIFIAYIAYMNHFQIKFEEEALTKIFGNEYALYMQRVRRWL